MIYHFEDVEIDTGLMELRRCGDIIDVEPRVLDLLLCLVGRRDRVVSKEELQDIVWPRVIVTESALTRTIMKARNALGDNADNPHFIQTVRGRGYRFIANVSSQDAPTADSDVQSVAVASFESLSESRALGFLAEGMTEDLIALLAGLTGFRVIGGGNEKDARYTVSGSIRPIGEQLRINVQLVDTSNDALVWADIYNRAPDQIADIQDNVIAIIAATIGNEVFRAESTRARQSDVKTLSAWGLLARSMAYYHSGFRRDHSSKSVELCREAVSVAPENPRALSSLAWHTAMLVTNDWSDDASTDRDVAMRCGQKAMDIDSGDHWVVYHWGAVNGYLDDPQRGIGILEHALELNANFVPALAQMGRCLIGVGRAAEALPYVQSAIELSPRDLNSFAMHLYIARAHLQLGEFERSVTAAQRSIDLNNSWNFAWFIHAMANAGAGRGDVARLSLQRCRELEPNSSIDSYKSRLMFAGGGDKTRVSALRAQLDELWSVVR